MFRHNILKDEWVLIAPNRAKNYSFFDQTHDFSSLDNPFLKNTESIYQDKEDWSVKVVSNKLSMLRLETSQKTHKNSFQDTRGGFGAHEMIIDSKDPKKHFFEFTSADHLGLLNAVKLRFFSLFKDKRIKSIIAFKEQGHMSGSLIPHSNSSLVAFGFIYPALDLQIRKSNEFFIKKERSLFDDLLQEARDNFLIIAQNLKFVAFVPFSARFEFEVWIMPIFSGANFCNLDETDLKLLAQITEQVTQKLHFCLPKVGLNWTLFSAPFEYEHAQIDYFYKLDEHFRWHIEITPRLKPLGALATQSGICINTVAPEDAASYLNK